MIIEHKLQELNEQRRNLTIELEATLDSMQNVCRRASERITFIQPTGKEIMFYQTSLIVHIVLVL